MEGLEGKILHSQAKDSQRGNKDSYSDYNSVQFTLTAKYVITV